jgi:MerR family copper efflux transcriptional regulator
MRIGELAKLTGLQVSTLRYYEQIGLLPVDERSEAGYRLFSDESVERVRFILGAKTLGFSLKEIRSVLTLYDKGHLPCDLASRLAEKKLRKMDQLITKWQERKHALQLALDTWQTGAPQDLPFCPILNVSINLYDRRLKEMVRTIEVFTAGCPLCDETLQRVRDAVATCGCQVVERAPDSAEAQQYGITAVPAIMVNGQLIFTGKPTAEQAVALLRQP